MTQLPPRPDPDQLRRQAKDLLRSARSNDSASLSRLAGVPAGLTLSAAQFALAREHGFPSWVALIQEVERRRTLDRGRPGEVRQMLARDSRLASIGMTAWADHPNGVSPLSYIAMRPFDTSRRRWGRPTANAGVVEALLRAGAPVDGLPTDRESPLITAASYGSTEVARALIDAGANIHRVASLDSGGVPGGTALLHAAVFGSTAIVDLLRDAGATPASIEEAAALGNVADWVDPVPPEDARVRALAMAADHERLDVIDCLIALGTPLDATDARFGRQALRLAAARGRTGSVAHLLARGADPSLRDEHGRSALMLCRDAKQHSTTAGHDAVARLLEHFTT